jgi:hypothetical protein
MVSAEQAMAFAPSTIRPSASLRDIVGWRSVGIESVGHDRPRSQAAHQVLLRCAPGHADHLVASRHELRDELSAENACGTGYEDLHRPSFRLIAL